MSTPVASTAGAQVEHKDPTARADIVVTMSVDTAPNPERIRPRTGPVLDVVVPVYNEEADLEPSVRRLHAYLSAAVPVPLPHHDRRQRQCRRHPGDRDPPRGAAPRGRVAADAGEGPRPGAAGRVDRVRRAGARLLRRGPLHRPRRAPPAGGPADQRPLGPGHRHPARPRLPRGARRQARVHLPLVQPDLARHPRRPLLRRAVRLQGHPRRRRATAGAARRGHRLVLRHGAARARRARRAAHPRGAGGLGRRPRLVGRHRAHRRRRPQGHRPARPRARDRPRPPAGPAREARPRRTRNPGTGGGGRAPRDDRTAGPVRGGRGGEHAGLPAALRAAADGPRRVRREPGGARRHRRGQHRRQPAADLRRARP